MIARSVSYFTNFSALFALALCLTLPVARIARAEDTDGAPDFDNSKYQAQGQINSNATYIHSGASEGDYPTAKLDKGSTITVVGIHGDWLKITPPDGSYCYVAKAWVEQHGDGTNRVGRVTNPLNVRVGSSLNAMKTKVAGRLDIGAEVTILGEQDEYFKIAPPKDVFLYVEKQYVDLVGNVAKNDTKQPAPGEPIKTPGDTQVAGTSTTPPAQPGDPTNVQPPTSPGDTALNSGTSPPPTTGPSEVAIGPSTTQPSGDSIATGPTTQPINAEADAENQFDALEKTYIEADKQTIDQQPLADLLTGYTKLAASTALPESLRRMCDYRVSTIKQRVDDQQKYLAVKKSQDEMKQKQLALQAEREELEARIKQSGVQYFTAVGTLRPSSLQQGSGTLYRLTDPSTGRTVVYVRTDDAKFAALSGQFIGVSGSVQKDESLAMKIITPKDFATVDQTKVNITVAADIVPPSLMPSSSQASVRSELSPESR